MSQTPAVLETKLLGGVPEILRDELLGAYGRIVRNFRERRWEPAELNGGKLCEVVHTIVKGYIDGKFPTHSSKPGNMVDACRALEKVPTTFPRSVRIQIPRVLIALYEIRSNRGVGHIDGDVDPNHMDATCVLEMSKWVMSELVRVFHDVSTEEAAKAVDALVDRTLPMVWKAGQNLRVLDPDLSMKGKVLLLLYHSQGVTAEKDLCRWVEHSNPSVFRRDVIRKAHREKLVEYDPEQGTVEISPRGAEYVERLLLK